MVLIEYPKCSTCKKAKAWLDSHKLVFRLCVMAMLLEDGK